MGNDRGVERRLATFGRRKVTPRACVADSKKHLRAFLREVLEDLGFVTSECARVEELGAILESDFPDLILLGIATDGIEPARFLEALLRHGVRNGAVPVISILGIELATSFLGAVVVEKVYALPGLGSMLLLAISQRDYPDVQGVLFVSTLLVLVIGFAADLLQRLIDPRLRGQVHTS